MPTISIKFSKILNSLHGLSTKSNSLHKFEIKLHTPNLIKVGIPKTQSEQHNGNWQIMLQELEPPKNERDSQK